MGVAALLILLIALWLLAKVSVEAQATARAHAVVAEARANSTNQEQFATFLTARVHSDFAEHAHGRWGSVLAKLRPLLTHRFLPDPLRLQEGALESLYPHGECDSAARALMFTLRVGEINAAQLNIVTPKAAHSAVLAVLHGKDPVLLDPDFGTVARSAKHLISAIEAQDLMRRGARSEEIWPSLSASSNTEFYRQFAKAVFSRQGEPMTMRAEVSLSEGKSKELGAADGQSEDVRIAGQHSRMTPYWSYMGHKYDRAWVRELTVHQPTRVVFGLVQRPKAKFITSERKPQIVGHQLVYSLPAEATLRFVDGRAGYDLLSLRSYLDVDYIRFEPLPDKSAN